MSMAERISSLLTGEGRASEPVGTLHVVDPSPLNWLYITYNTVEELVRMDTDGAIVPAAMKSLPGSHKLQDHNKRWFVQNQTTLWYPPRFFVQS